MVFTHSLFNKVTIGNDLLRLHDILVTNMKFLNKIFHLLIFLSFRDMESSIRSILKYVIIISEVIGVKGSRTLKVIRIYQYFSTALYHMLSKIFIEFDTLIMVKSLIQRIIIIGN